MASATKWPCNSREARLQVEQQRAQNINNLQPTVANMPAADDSKRKAARETIDILHEISTLLVRAILIAAVPNFRTDSTNRTPTLIGSHCRTACR